MNISRLNILRINFSRFLKRLVFGDRVLAGTATSLRNVVVWVFIALVAAFLTDPSDGSPGMPAKLAPWPAELGLDGNITAVPANSVVPAMPRIIFSPAPAPARVSSPASHSA